MSCGQSISCLLDSVVLSPDPREFGVVTEGSISVNSGQTLSLSPHPGAVTPRIPVEVSVIVAVWGRRSRVNTRRVPLQPCKGFPAEELAAPGFNPLNLLLFPNFVAESMQDPSLEQHGLGEGWEGCGCGHYQMCKGHQPSVVPRPSLAIAVAPSGIPFL